jgi:glyoxylase-like metal-dependent hydrolase (beta-lactamase superfamily II)
MQNAPARRTRSEERNGSTKRSTAARLTRNVVPGVHQLEHAGVNCYLLVDGEEWTLVDAALPATWGALLKAVSVLGLSLQGLRGIVLTHGHFDHVGCARRLADEWMVPVYVHAADHHLAAHPYHYARERSPLSYPFLYPKAIPTLTAMTRAGALWVRGVERVEDLKPGHCLDLPGSPEVLFTPGHTFGHCSLHLPAQKTVVAGDALVTLDPYKGVRGPQVVAGAATADSPLALASLAAIAETGANTILPGHGDPWFGGADAAVAAAKYAGAS